MTLSTTVRLTTPLSSVKLLDYLTVLVGGNPATARRQTRTYDGLEEVANQIDQGFKAIVQVRWSPDGPLPPHGIYFDPQDYLDEGEEVPPPDPEGAIEVWLDTTYAYRGEDGEDCEQLHNRLAIEMLAFARVIDPKAKAWKNLDIRGEWEVVE